MTEAAEKRIGSVIANKWRVDALIGSGSMAAVYAVTHRNGARAALKILHPTLCVDESVCERFLGEGYLTNSIKHAGIVRVHDDGMTEDGCVFLVMDLLEGRTFEAYRQEQGGRLGVSTVLDIADELMDILHVVHQAGIIHRDLKPQNIFLCDDGSVKLLDFGVARIKNGSAVARSLFGLVLGTPSFMAPEQASGSREDVDFRTDIWSLGATLFTSLTGETVHLAPNVQAKILAAATAKARSIAPVRQDLPASVALAIDMALRFNKEDRWQSVDAFRRAVRDARTQAGLGEPRPIPVRFDDITIPDPPKESLPEGYLVKKADAKKPAAKKADAKKPDAKKPAKVPSQMPTLAGLGHSSAPPPPVVLRTDRRLTEEIDAETSGPLSFFTEDRMLLAELKGSRGYVWKVAGGLALVAGAAFAFLSTRHPAPGPSESATAGQFANPPGTDDRLAIPPPVPIDSKEGAKDAAMPPATPPKSSMTASERARVAHSIQPSIIKRSPAPTYTMAPPPAPDPIPPSQPMPKAVHQSVKEEAPVTPAPAASDPFSTPE